MAAMRKLKRSRGVSASGPQPAVCEQGTQSKSRQCQTEAARLRINDMRGGLVDLRQEAVEPIDAPPRGVALSG